MKSDVSLSMELGNFYHGVHGVHGVFTERSILHFQFSILHFPSNPYLYPMCTASWNEYALRDHLGNPKEFNSDFGLDWCCPERSCPLHHVMRRIFSHTLTGVGILLIVFVLLGCGESVSYTPSEEIGVKSDSLEKSGLSLDNL